MSSYTLRKFIKHIKDSKKQNRTLKAKKFCMEFSSKLYNHIYKNKTPHIPLKYNSNYFKFRTHSGSKRKLVFSNSTPLLTKNYNIRSYVYDKDTFDTWDKPFLDTLFSKKPIYKSYRYSFEMRLVNYMSHNYLVNEPKGTTLWIEKMLKEITLTKNDIFLTYLKKHITYLKKYEYYRIFEEMYYSIVVALFRFNTTRQYNEIKKDISMRKNLDLIKKKIAFPHIATQAMISSMYACSIPEEKIVSAISYICWSTTFYDLIPQPSSRQSKSI